MTSKKSTKVKKAQPGKKSAERAGGAAAKKAVKVFDPSAPAHADSGIYGLMSNPDESAVHLIPVPFEATTSYGGGTSRGPAAILDASRQVDLFDIDTGRPYESGIYLWPESKEIVRLNKDAKKAAQAVIAAETGKGSAKNIEKLLSVVNAAGERVNAIVQKEAADALDAGKMVGVVGGDHSTPFGLIKEIAHRHAGVGILHFDAHHDLRAAYEGFEWSHASIMYNVMTKVSGVGRLVQVGIRDFSECEAEFARNSEGRIVVFYDRNLAVDRMNGKPFAATTRAIIDSLPDEVYVSFDIDGLDPRYCPNTGTPVLGGLDIHEAVHILRELVASGKKIVGFDLNEVSPGEDEWDANVGARVLYKLIGFALLGRAGGGK